MVYRIDLVSINSSGDTTTLDITDDVVIGFSSLEKLDESLDIGSMEIPFSTQSTTYTIWDTINIYIDSSVVASFRISGDTVSLVSKNPLVYSHSLSLVEHTKILERVIVTGYTVTQPIDPDETKKNLRDVLLDLMNTQPLELNSLYSTTRLFDVTTELRSFLVDIVSPEFTWNNMTLRECVDDIATYVNAIARLKSNSFLQFDFINDL
ncbi:MAG: hypothetical protein GQ557_01215, partial [Mycoplasmataceae bacterium]|nr:hypothetical protein [Mycoplasmataceae bacterium]